MIKDEWRYLLREHRGAWAAALVELSDRLGRARHTSEMTQALGEILGRGRRPDRGAERAGDVFRRRHVREEVERLEHDADAPAAEARERILSPGVGATPLRGPVDRLDARERERPLLWRGPRRIEEPELHRARRARDELDLRADDRVRRRRGPPERSSTSFACMPASATSEVPTR